MYTLLTIPYSHYCERARWALDYAEIDYQEEGHAPFLHAYYNHKVGAQRMVPALITPQGIINGSDQILNFVHPFKSLYRPELKQSTQSWEQRFDRGFGIKSRVWAYIHLQHAPELLHAVLEQGSPQEYKLIKPLVPYALQRIIQFYKAYPHRLRAVLRDLNALLDQCDFVLKDGRPFFMGETFSAADITLCALAGILVFPPEYGFAYPRLEKFPEPMQSQIQAWRSRPVGQYILRTYANHRPRFGV